MKLRRAEDRNDQPPGHEPNLVTPAGKGRDHLVRQAPPAEHLTERPGRHAGGQAPARVARTWRRIGKVPLSFINGRASYFSRSPCRARVKGHRGNALSWSSSPGPESCRRGQFRRQLTRRGGVRRRARRGSWGGRHPYRPSFGPLHLLIDATGVKAEGAGEWLARQHGPSRPRDRRRCTLGTMPGHRKSGRSR